MIGFWTKAKGGEVLRVLVVGAGIGGLTAAVALLRLGIDVRVYEQANALGEVGAGVALGPNAVKVLQRLGVAQNFGAAAVVPASLDTRDWQNGAVLGRVLLGDAAISRWGAPFYHLHRADVHNALRVASGDGCIVLGARATTIETSDSHVVVRFADGRSATGDVLIGADGIHSVVRDHVAGADRAIWSRQVSWRGLASASVGKAIGLETRHHSFWGPRKQFVCFYVSGGRLVNWVGNTQSDQEWVEESWSARGDRDEVAGLFKDWHPQVRALIAGTEQVYKWALFDRLPLQNWTRGRVTVLGDAAHPMLPYMAQGASQSIEDAYILANSLAKTPDDPLGAINSYAQRRQERTAAVQNASREAGKAMQLTDPAEVAIRNANLRESPEAPAARFDWIWGYDATNAIDPPSNI